MPEGRVTGINTAREHAIRKELNRLLESPAFRTSKRCRQFLEYVVEHTIAGPAGALKERSIGVDLFELSPDFDTGQHTIVRVTANEVRKKLAQQYNAENGSPHAVRLELPPGSYAAEFSWEAPAETPPPALPPPPPSQPAVPTAPVPAPIPARAGWQTNAALPFVLAILVIAGGFAWWKREGKAISAAAGSKPVAGSVPGLVSGDDLRMIVGATGAYVDRSGRTWGPDRYFSGGAVIGHSSEKILRTLDPDIYRHMRQGDFKYDIPLKPGSYEMHLHFAETGLQDFISAESSGEGQRVFRIVGNGKPILDFFDVVADAAGTNVSDERVFRNVSPGADGLLHLSFSSIRGTAILSGIELLPSNGDKIRPLRIRAGWASSWQGSDEVQWQSDSYFMGGNALVRTTNPARESNSIPAQDVALYGSERWGHFSYALPVADGQYRVSLRFCEGHYGHKNTGFGGEGSRWFDVYCNGVALLRNFDIFKEAGGEGKPIEKAFAHIRPTAQGKIVLTFVPVRGMACVNGIEVTQE